MIHTFCLGSLYAIIAKLTNYYFKSFFFIIFMAAIPTHSPIAKGAGSLRISILGDPGTGKLILTWLNIIGKQTFLSSLNGHRSAEELKDDSDYADVSFRDFKNDLNVTFRFHNSHAYLPGSMCAIVLYDSSSEQSFDSAKTK